jgi:DNA polymerase-1
MLMERILWGGYYDSFGLDDLARRYLDIYVDKTLQDSFSDTTELSPEQIEYACIDANVTLRIWNEQRKHVTKTDFNIWKSIDMPALWSVMDFQGFRIDADKWNTLAEENKRKRDEIDKSLPINPRSPKQVVQYLSGCGFKGISSSGEDILEQNIKKHPDTEAAKIARQILESRCYGKRASTYGTSFIRDYLEQENDYNIIVCNYNITAAESGRMSATNPAMHQVPSKDTKEFRECFIARPGNKLVIADYSAQEFGIAAWVSKDDKMLDVFNNSKDVYIRMAKEMYNKDIKKGDPMRTTMKSTILGVDYGMSKYGLADREGISVDEAAEIIELFCDTFPKMARYMDRIMEQKKSVQTVLGRRAWLNPYSSQCPRNALNSPIQGTAGDCIKLALGQLHQHWNEQGFDYPFAVVEVTHDEIGADVPERIAPKVAEFMSNTMVRVANDMMPGALFRASASIVNSWAEKD